MLGLKRGAVALYPHEKAWETEAQATMARLRQILGSVCIYRGSYARAAPRLRQAARAVSSGASLAMTLLLTRWAPRSLHWSSQVCIHSPSPQP